MGLFGTLISFGAGYAAGMKFGDKRVNAFRNVKEEARDKESHWRRPRAICARGRWAKVGARSMCAPCVR